MKQGNKKVGYGCPPTEKQFKKGVSGNPNGRPKGSKDIDILAMFGKEMLEKITLSDGSKITKMDAVVKGTVNDAIKGDVKNRKIALDLMNKFEKNDFKKQFFERLLKDGYITEEDAKNYVKYASRLDLNAPDSVIERIYKGQTIKRNTARDTVMWMNYVRDLYDYMGLAMYAEFIMSQISTEIDFWEGVDATLDAIKIPDMEREKVTRKIQKTRKHSRPSDDLYIQSQHLYLKLLQKIKLFVEDLDEIALNTPFYHEEQKAIFGEENMAKALKTAKETKTKQEYESLKSYIESRPLSGASSEIMFSIVDEFEEELADFIQDKMLDVFKWAGVTFDFSRIL